MSDTVRITQKELEPLPRWARLAFAGRCLRRAQTLLYGPAEQMAVLSSALKQIEAAAAGRGAGDELADAAASAYTLALDNLDSGDVSSMPENDTIVTCMVAHATAFAAEAATLSDTHLAAHLIGQSIDFAIHAFRVAHATDAVRAIAAMRADLTRLVETAASDGWDEKTRVAADWFGAL
jgi:hypothetical protein